MPLSRETELYRRDALSSGKLLTPRERAAILKPYLPSTQKKATSTKPGASAQKRKPIRDFLRSILYLAVFTTIHFLFSIYIRVRQYYHAIKNRILAVIYYHHRTPELIRKDVKHLGRLPQHLSVILRLEEDGGGHGGIEVLLDNVAEIAAWCASVGIPMLSVYERTGALKSYIPTTHRAVAAKFHSYFGSKRPSLRVRAPLLDSFMNGDIAQEAENSEEDSGSLGNLSLLLLASEDGRSNIVDLTKTLAEMSQHNKLSPADISMDLIDAEITNSVMGEPDLLLLFGPDVKLDGYPPWQLRLTEIFHVQDNQEVEYLVWLKGLHRYAKAEMRFGR